MKMKRWEKKEMGRENESNQWGRRRRRRVEKSKSLKYILINGKRWHWKKKKKWLDSFLLRGARTVCCANLVCIKVVLVWRMSWVGNKLLYTPLLGMSMTRWFRVFLWLHILNSTIAINSNNCFLSICKWMYVCIPLHEFSILVILFISIWKKYYFATV